MSDEWNGLAVLLANLIEKYAPELDIDDMPDPRRSIGGSASGCDTKYMDIPIVEKRAA